MSTKIVQPKNLDISDITFDAVKKTQMGGNIVYFKYEGSPRRVVQTPVMHAPFGLSTYTDDKTGVTKYSLDVSFRGMDEDPKIQQFFEKMQEFDSYTMDTAVANSKEWFGKKQSKEVIENFYRPLVKASKDPTKYAPTMKMKIQTKRNGDVDLTAFDNEQNAINIMESLTPGAKIKAIIEASSVWFVNKTMFGITWKLVQLQMMPSDKISGFSFQEEDDEEEYEEEVVADN